MSTRKRLRHTNATAYLVPPSLFRNVETGWSDLTTHKLTLHRLTEEANEYTHIIGTVRDGIEPSVKCISGHKMQMQASRAGVMENTKSWVLLVDLSKAPVGRDFDLEYTVSFQNGFPGKSQEWAAVLVSHPTTELKIEIAFPPGKPARNFRYSYYSFTPGSAREKYSAPNAPAGVSPTSELSWETKNPPIGRFYRVDWDW